MCYTCKTNDAKLGTSVYDFIHVLYTIFLIKYLIKNVFITFKT